MVHAVFYFCEGRFVFSAFPLAVRQVGLSADGPQRYTGGKPFLTTMGYDGNSTTVQNYTVIDLPA